MDKAMGIKPLLDAAKARRAKLTEKLTKLTDAPQVEGRTALTEDEAAKFEKLAVEIREIDGQIDSFTAALAGEERTAAAASVGTAHTFEANGSPAVVVREAMTYDQHGNQSYMRDLGLIAAAGLDFSYRGAASDALGRMNQHAKEVEVEARHDSVLAARLQEMRKTPANLREQRVNPNTTAGTGGEFVPPLWLVSQYVPFVRPGRVFADRVQNLALPPGIDVINLPKITTGSQAAIQANQGGAVQSVDIVTSTVSAKVNTIAGQEDISLQLLEQSPISMDGVIYDDLSRDYDQRLDLQVIAGSGLNGQHLGVCAVPGSTANTSILNASFINASGATGLNPATAAGEFRSLLNGVNQIETLRFSNPTAIWVHPRRANFWSAAADTTNRPLYIPAKYGQYNTVGINEGAPTFQGVAGELLGLPVVKDANMVTTGTGAPSGATFNLTGGTQDVVAVLKEDDLYLWEGTMRMRALPEILSGTLQIRYQLYAYSAFMPNRFPVSIALFQGAATAAPTF